MQQRFRFALSLLASGLALALVAGGCKKKAPTAPPPAPAEEKKAVPEEVPPPPPRPAPQPEVKESPLSEDLATLNARGYLRDAFYEFDKSDLREDARATLAFDAEWLKKYSSIQILIEGHCDERGTEEYNLGLGDRRANVAKEYLASLGIDASRVKVISYGKTRPFCAEHEESCWQQNRRAHFVITAK